MKEAFSNPPASVYDTFVACLARHGMTPETISPMERGLILEMVAFSYTCAVGRMCANLPPPERCRRDSDKVALQMRTEALQVLHEVAHATEQPQAGKRRLNG